MRNGRANACLQHGTLKAIPALHTVFPPRTQPRLTPIFLPSSSKGFGSVDVCRVTARRRRSLRKLCSSSLDRYACSHPEPFERSRTECQLGFCFLVRRPAEPGGVVNAIRPGVPQSLLFRDGWRLRRANEFCKRWKPHGLCNRLIVNHVIHARVRGSAAQVAAAASSICTQFQIPSPLPITGASRRRT